MDKLQLYPIVDVGHQENGNQFTQIGEGIPEDESLAKIHGECAQPSCFRKKLYKCQNAVYRNNPKDMDEFLPNQYFDEHTPIAVEYHEQPDTESVSQYSGQSIEPGDGNQGKRYEKEQPEEVEQVQAGFYQQDTHDFPFRNRKQEKRLDGLYRCRKQETEDEVQNQKDYQDLVQYMIRFHVGKPVFKCKGQHDPEKYEVCCPECNSEIHQELGKAVLVEHRTPLCVKFLKFTYISV